MWRLNLQSHFCRISLNSTRQTCGVWIRRETRINWSKLSENLSIIISERMIFLFPSEEREKIGRPLLFLSKTSFFWKSHGLFFDQVKITKIKHLKLFGNFTARKGFHPLVGAFANHKAGHAKMIWCTWSNMMPMQRLSARKMAFCLERIFLRGRGFELSTEPRKHFFL